MVTTPPELIAIASVSEALPMLPASAITNPAPDVITAPDTISLLKVALPAALPSIVKNVVSELSSVPLKIISLSFACASIVISPEVVVRVTAASPAPKSSAAPAPIYVLILDAVTFLFVPPAPSSTINKSASTTPAPMSVPPSISKSAIAILPSGKTGFCEKVTTPPEDIAIASVSEVCPIFVPLIIILSTVRVVSVPNEVILD